MRKILLFLLLLIAILFLVSCAPGEEAVAGEATRVTRCGDGIKQAPNGYGVMEQCDDGNTNSTDTCSSCLLTACGDGITQPLNGYGKVEQCDDGNAINTDACSAV
ncbi:MAG: DUF4215 domain-containing protein, partial [Nanoarchaeota archaeon]